MMLTKRQTNGHESNIALVEVIINFVLLFVILTSREGQDKTIFFGAESPVDVHFYTELLSTPDSKYGPTEVIRVVENFVGSLLQINTDTDRYPFWFFILIGFCFGS